MKQSFEPMIGEFSQKIIEFLLISWYFSRVYSAHISTELIFDLLEKTIKLMRLEFVYFS